MERLKQTVDVYFGYFSASRTKRKKKNHTKLSELRKVQLNTAGKKKKQERKERRHINNKCVLFEVQLPAEVCPTCGLSRGQRGRSDAHGQQERQPERAPQGRHSSAGRGGTRSSEARLRRHPPIACCPAERRPRTPRETVPQVLEGSEERERDHQILQHAITKTERGRSASGSGHMQPYSDLTFHIDFKD